MNGLTDRQIRFIDEYLIDNNGKQAAIRSGYSEKSAEVQASRMLSNAKVLAVLRERQEQLANKYEVTRERVVEEYAKLAFFNIKNAFDDNGGLIDIKQMDDDISAAIAGLEVSEITSGSGDEKTAIGQLKKIRLTDKRAALDSLCKVLGYNAPEKTESNVRILTDLKELTDDELLQLVNNRDKS